MSIEARLRGFILDQLCQGGDPVELTDDTELIRGGILDSLRLLELVAFIQGEYGIQVDDMDLVLDNFATVTTIASYTRHKADARSDTQVT